MRAAAATGALAAALALSACAAPPAPPLPLSVGNGRGSQYGNYGAQAAGEGRGPAGEHCVIFNWDRPLTADLAIRYVSASCESKERPGRMVCTELSRTVIPMSQSNLKDAPGDPGQ